MHRNSGKRAGGLWRLLAAAGLIASAAFAAGAEGLDSGGISPESRLRATVACMELGRALFEKGDVHRAAMEFHKALELDPGNRVAEDFVRRCAPCTDRK